MPRRVYEPRLPQFVCERCGSKYIHQSGLCRHQATPGACQKVLELKGPLEVESFERKIPCGDCTAKFRSHEFREKHRARFHVPLWPD